MGKGTQACPTKKQHAGAARGCQGIKQGCRDRKVTELEKAVLGEGTEEPLGRGRSMVVAAAAAVAVVSVAA